MSALTKRFFSRWHLDNIKVVRRVIVSVVAAAVSAAWLWFRSSFGEPPAIDHAISHGENYSAGL